MFKKFGFILMLFAGFSLVFCGSSIWAAQRKAPNKSKVDLVVSKVELARVETRGRHQMQLIVFIKNLCNGRTDKRIKIQIPSIKSFWIEGGIGPLQDKMSMPILFDVSGDSVSMGNFDCIVDSDNKVKETNEKNNTANFPGMKGTEDRKVYRCRIEK